tara:strand:+ start:953 stop:1195 length:243 start_codon:yes stop_codon:yes gene_type:complete
MISWIIYIIVGLILVFVLYIAILGINRGVKAKNVNKSNNLENKLSSQKNISNELEKLKKLYDGGVINKKEFNIAKKKLLS